MRWLLIILFLCVSCDRIYAPKYVQKENLSVYTLKEGRFTDDDIFSNMTTDGRVYIIPLDEYISTVSIIQVSISCGGNWNQIGFEINTGMTEIYVNKRDAYMLSCKYKIVINEQKW